MVRYQYRKSIGEHIILQRLKNNLLTYLHDNNIWLHPQPKYHHPLFEILEDYSALLRKRIFHSKRHMNRLSKNRFYEIPDGDDLHYICNTL
jgi:hypothetical protein